jgi:hypothetical protein
MRQHGKNYTEVADYYNKQTPGLLRRPDNLRHKYKKLIATKEKTGDPHEDPFVGIALPYLLLVITDSYVSSFLNNQ